MMKWDAVINNSWLQTSSQFDTLRSSNKIIPTEMDISKYNFPNIENDHTDSSFLSTVSLLSP